MSSIYWIIHSYEMFRKDKFIRTESKLAVAWAEVDSLNGHAGLMGG